MITYASSTIGVFVRVGAPWQPGDFPADAVEIPDKPQAWSTWDGTQWITGPEPLAPIAERRAAATLPRAVFLEAAVTFQIIGQDVAEVAADGTFPPEFAAFLSGLSDRERLEARSAWADARDVRRDSIILAQIAASQGVTEAQLDQMFGVAPE